MWFSLTWYLFFKHLLVWIVRNFTFLSIWLFVAVYVYFRKVSIWSLEWSRTLTFLFQVAECSEHRCAQSIFFLLPLFNFEFSLNFAKLIFSCYYYFWERSIKITFSLIQVFQISYLCPLFLFGYLAPGNSDWSSLWWMSRSQTSSLCL